MEKHCPTCTCPDVRALPVAVAGPAQTGILLVTANAEGYEGRVYDMPPGGADGARIEDLHLRAAGQYDRDGTLIRPIDAPGDRDG